MFRQAVTISSFSVDDLQMANVFYSEVAELEVHELEMGLLKSKVDGGHAIIHLSEA